MKKYKLIFNLLIVLFLFSSIASSDKMVTINWGGKSEITYEQGFMYHLRKHPYGGISLFDQELVENDSPGFREDPYPGFDDAIWGDKRARKVFNLDDPRTNSVWLVIAVREFGKKYPLKCAVNGHEKVMNSISKKPNIEWCRWEEFPAEYLKKGKNTIDLYCPEAKTEEDAWKIMISRADKFEEGGGDPTHVGETSYKSIDGGKKWKQSPFGPKEDIKAEYAVMLSFDRYVETGWLASPVIDLWKGSSNDLIVPLRQIQKLKLSIKSIVPDETNIEYFFRKGLSPQPYSSEWESYKLIGSGEQIDFEIGGPDLNRRYVQFKAVLSTKNPLKSPIIKSTELSAELNQIIQLHDNIHVVDFENPKIKYSSVNWQWEPWDRPELKEIRERENLDEVIAGSRTEFEAQVRLLNYVTRRWPWGSPWPEYPRSDALSILNRVEYAGGGGYCSNFARTLSGLCISCGWQAREVFVSYHEVMEVWNDDFGKWIYLDAGAGIRANHYHYDPETNEPLNLLDLHFKYLEYFYPGEKIDWMKGSIYPNKYKEDQLPPVKRGSLEHHKKGELLGFDCAAFVRTLPRNNWFQKPIPIPLIHGSSSKNPSNGYIHWYDEQTPPKRNYSWYTDRPQDMWPDVNKVYIDITSGFGNDRLFLRFETYTPNFSHFEVDVDDTGWKKVGERWTWLLQSGRNNLRVRAVNKFGVCGKPSSVVLNHADAP